MADTVLVDASEVVSFSKAMLEQPKVLERKVHGSLTRFTNIVQRDAIANAEKDRPWLGTTKGIRKDTKTLARRIYSPPDLRRRKRDGAEVAANVALANEFGTAKMAPQPAIVPAFTRQRAPFIADQNRIIEDVLRQ